MKYFVLKCLFLLIMNGALAQGSNLVIFSEDGDNFTLFVNGERKNAGPAANVKAPGIQADGCKIRVTFQDAAIPEISKYIMLTSGEETTFGIKKNKKGEYVLRIVSSSPIPSDSYQVTSQANNTASQNNSSSTSTVTTTTTTTQATQENATLTMNVNGSEKKSSNADNVNMSLSVSDGANASFSMNVTATSTEQNKTSKADNVSVNVSAPVTTSTTTVTTTSSNTNSAQASYSNNCEMTSADYQKALSAIKAQSFADTKMSTAKQAVKNRCVTVDQVRGIAQLFDFEDGKLDFIKYAYSLTSDKDNYYTLSDVFTHSSTVDELNEFLESK